MSTADTLIIDANTRLQQNTASDPKHSAWVSANAGSGKTHVLAQRVVRLLLAGTNPSRLLCLTYTKAAAGEMSNRIFDTLGKWAVYNETDLRKALTEVEGNPPTKAQLERAPTLFARALETPGGLKIQTIHAFCEALLHQFPLEANVPGSFTVMDDRTQSQLLEQARRSVIVEADAQPSSKNAQALSAMMDVAGDHAIEKVLKEVITERDGVSDWLSRVGGSEAATLLARSNFRFSEADTVANLAAALASKTQIADMDLQAASEACRGIAQKGAQTLADQFDAVRQSTDPRETLTVLKVMLFTSAGAQRKFTNYPTNPVEEALPGIRATFGQDATLLEEGSARINTLRCIESTEPLLKIGQTIIDRYRLEKRLRGLLDFDDLVAATSRLLSRSDARPWVLYKLDLGIDHILLDEAQDTSAVQWQIISALVSEFFAGKSARSEDRTVFAVGDAKQSIYSFQGAVPEIFAKQRREYKRRADGAEKPFEPVNLNLSFRSTQDVLSAVDTVFSIPEHGKGIVFQEDYQRHTAARFEAPGLVEVWPVIHARKKAEAEDWHIFPDVSDNRHQAIRMADRIADQLKDWLGSERLQASGKLIVPGDILVLVRSRDLFINAFTRELKERGIPVAGADRLVVTDHIAIQDLIALGQFMVTPDDDLSLAAVLKSPLIGLTEDDLYAISRARFPGKYEFSLFEALGKLAQNGLYGDTLETLNKWRARADRLPVYEFYARILGTDGGRQAFYKRLGTEAEDVLDAFLAAALSHEQDKLPGLQAFLESLVGEAPEIKRQLDQASGEVRVMTVHAAKGLEAPVVFLVDNCGDAFQSQHIPSLYRWGEEENEGGYLWVPSAVDHGDVTTPLKDLAREKAEEEYRRLLYVGMTRAKDRLIVCGYTSREMKDGEPAKLPDPNWHTMVSTALSPNWVAVTNNDGEVIARQWRISDPEMASLGLTSVEDTSQSSDHKELPAWVTHKLPREVDLPRPLTPSGAQALIDESAMEERVIPSLLEPSVAKTGVDPRRRGTVLHTLLQHLPEMEEPDRWNLAENYLAAALPEFSDAARDAMLAAIKRTITDPALASCFDPETSRAEVPIMGRIDLASGPRSLSGTVDRLAVLENEIVCLDYKTSRHVPQDEDNVPDDYVAQMALYQMLIAKLYPEKPIRVALVYSHAPDHPAVIFLSEARLEAALSRIAQL